MKLTLQLESTKHTRQVDKPVNTDAAWGLIEDAWSKANNLSLSESERQLKHHWVGGALAVYASLTGENAVALKERLPAPSQPSTSEPFNPLGMFREGRSTPAPPPHPGSQRPVD